MAFARCHFVALRGCKVVVTSLKVLREREWLAVGINIKRVGKLNLLSQQVYSKISDYSIDGFRQSRMHERDRHHLGASRSHIPALARFPISRQNGSLHPLDAHSSLHNVPSSQSLPIRTPTRLPHLVNDSHKTPHHLTFHSRRVASPKRRRLCCHGSRNGHRGRNRSTSNPSRNRPTGLSHANPYLTRWYRSDRIRRDEIFFTKRCTAFTRCDRGMGTCETGTGLGERGACGGGTWSETRVVFHDPSFGERGR